MTSRNDGWFERRILSPYLHRLTVYALLATHQTTGKYNDDTDASDG